MYLGPIADVEGRARGPWLQAASGEGAAVEGQVAVGVTAVVEAAGCEEQRLGYGLLHATHRKCRNRNNRKKEGPPLSWQRSSPLCAQCMGKRGRRHEARTH